MISACHSGSRKQIGGIHYGYNCTHGLPVYRAHLLLNVLTFAYCRNVVCSGNVLKVLLKINVYGSICWSLNNVLICRKTGYELCLVNNISRQPVTVQTRHTSATPTTSPANHVFNVSHRLRHLSVTFSININRQPRHPSSTQRATILPFNHSYTSSTKSPFSHVHHYSSTTSPINKSPINHVPHQPCH